MTGAVLLCFNGSEVAAEAIRVAAGLLPGRETFVLTVAIPAKDELPLDPVGDLVGRLSGLYREWDEIGAELAKRQARRGCEIAREGGLHARPLTATGRPAPTILRIADDHHAAVIVLGAAGHTGLGNALGSVSARVVQHATRPVLVIPKH